MYIGGMLDKMNILHPPERRRMLHYHRSLSLSVFTVATAWVDICPLSRYCVVNCLHSTHVLCGHFCWFPRPLGHSLCVS